MKIGILVFGCLSLASGLVLLAISVGLGSRLFYWFLGLGILSILAAYSYTAGSRPYGYAGLGDLAVLLFFGILGVGGTYFLYAREFDLSILLPAFAMGALATAVLNINNIRDIEADTRAGKNTVPVRLGRSKAVVYHWFLLLGAILATGWYIFGYQYNNLAWLYLPALPLLFVNGYRVTVTRDSKDLDPYLKQLALSSLLFMLLSGLAMAF